MPAVRCEPVADLVAAAEKVHADDRLVTSPEVLLGHVEGLLHARSTIDAVLVRQLRTAQGMDATTEVCGRSVKGWLHEEQLLAGPDAARLVRLGRVLVDYPVTAAAFDAREINTGHASAIVAALQSLPGQIRDTIEPHLVARARQYPPEEIAGFVDELLQRLGIDTAGDVRRERRHATRGVDVARTLDGARSVSGTLTPEVGERFEAALARAGAKTGPDDDRTPRQRHHDALGVIADTFLARTEPSFTGAPRTVIVTVDLATLEGRLREAWLTMPPTINGTAIVPAGTARRLACDAELIPVVLGGPSEVLDAGQAGREFTTAVRSLFVTRSDAAEVEAR